MKSQNVRKPLVGQTVLILDEDLAFLFWLGELLVEAGYQAVPALSCQQAFSHIRQFDVEVDVVIVNPDLLGVDNLLQCLGRGNRQLRLVIIKNPGSAVPGWIPPSAVLQRPRRSEALSARDWLERVEKTLKDAPLLREHYPITDLH